jgi:hypothetical protein
MGLTEKTKELADVALQKAGQLSETARDKAPGYIDKAADATVKAVDAATSGIDRVTGRRFHDKLDGAAARMEEGLDRPRSARPATDTAEVVEEPGATPPTTASPSPTPPITPSATNPEATDPGTPKP